VNVDAHIAKSAAVAGIVRSIAEGEAGGNADVNVEIAHMSRTGKRAWTSARGRGRHRRRSSSAAAAKTGSQGTDGQDGGGGGLIPDLFIFMRS
jgi:hypothetical protein